MSLMLFLVLIAIGLIFFELGLPWLGSAFIIGAFAIEIIIILTKFFSGTKKVAKALGKGIPAEVEKAEGQYPSMGIWEEGLKEAGSATGKQLFAPGEIPNKPGEMDSYRWKFKGAASASSGVKKFADAFKKLLGM